MDIQNLLPKEKYISKKKHCTNQHMNMNMIMISL